MTAVAPAAQADDTFELATELRQTVKPAAITTHLESLDAIGAAHDGARASGTTGYMASVDYVVSELKDAGYKPTTQAFEFPFFQELSPSVLESGGTSYETGAFTFSGPGDVTAPVQGVDLALEAPSTSTSGCESADFAGFTAGRIALVQRGACTFASPPLCSITPSSTSVIGNATWATPPGAVKVPGRIGVTPRSSRAGTSRWSSTTVVVPSTSSSSVTAGAGAAVTASAAAVAAIPPATRRKTVIWGLPEGCEAARVATRSPVVPRPSRS